MQKIREFEPADRYRYDFGLCTPKNGYAQVDTDSDASYFGTWANPFKLVIFNYCEGDCTTTICETVEEFVEEVRELARWHNESGSFCKIDPGLKGDIEQRFIEIGLKDLLH